MDSSGTVDAVPTEGPQSQMDSSGSVDAVPTEGPQSQMDSSGTVDAVFAEVATFAPVNEQYAPHIVSVVGEPRVTYSIPSGYAPATGGLLTIKKAVTAVETGNGCGNRLRVDVEITSGKKDKNYNEIKDIDIYELVDESLNIVPPADDIDEVSNVVCPEKLKNLLCERNYESFSDIPLINFKKLSSLEEIGYQRLDLLRDRPLSSDDPDLYKKVDVSYELETSSKYYSPNIISNYIFYWNKSLELDNQSIDYIKNIGNLSKYMKDKFNVRWLEPYHANINYTKRCDGKIVAMNITDTDESNEWIRLEIDDPERNNGTALLNISGQTTYYLTFDTDKTNKDICRISDWNGMMRFHIESLRSKDRLFYWYYVRPKTSGDFNTESIVRIKDKDYNGWPDLIYPLNIKVDEPDYRFEVNPILEDSRVYAYLSFLDWPQIGWGRLGIKYIITYKGVSSTTYLRNVEVKITPNAGCQCYYNESGGPIKSNDLTSIESFVDSKTISLERKISYNSTGTYLIPAIWIEGNPYIFKDTVTVDDQLTRLLNFITSYYTIITALLAIFVGNVFQDYLHRQIMLISRKIKYIYFIFTSTIGIKEKEQEANEAELSPKTWHWTNSNRNEKWK